MARSLATIKSEIKTEIRNYSSLDNFLFPEDGGSQVSVFNLLITVVAAAILTFEALHDIFKADLTAISNASISGNQKWLQQQMYNWQYGDIILLDDNYSPYYAVEDDTKKIVTQCAVVDGNPVIIKVGKGTHPSITALSAAELTAINDYYYGTSVQEGIGFAGVSATFISSLPDRLYVEADVYYAAQYVAADVKTNVIAAINSFLSTFQDENFNGVLFVIKLTDAIQTVTGVSRVDYASIKGRPQSVALGSASEVDLQGYYQTYSGSIIEEDTAGSTFADKITMVPETL